MLLDVLSIVNFALTAMLCTVIFFLHRKGNNDNK